MVSKKHPAFTIVELLVVIVVIGILAAITIASYSGISSKAITASLTSDLDNASRQLKMFQVDNSAYPGTINCAIPDSTTNKCVKSSANTNYQYTVSNTNPQTFCITATKGAQSYKITNDSIPATGGCPGHGVGGVSPITNLVTNPSVETNGTSWNSYTNGGSTMSRVSGGAFSGTWFYRVQFTASGNGGIYFYHLSVQPNTQYTLSGRVRVNNSHTVAASIEWYNSSSSILGGNNGSPVALTPNTWTQLSVSGVAPATADFLTLTFYISSGTWSVGDTLDGDAIMGIQGSNDYIFADGNSANWIWNGVVNNSTSTGPPS